MFPLSSYIYTLFIIHSPPLSLSRRLHFHLSIPPPYLYSSNPFPHTPIVGVRSRSSPPPGVSSDLPNLHICVYIRVLFGGALAEVVEGSSASSSFPGVIVRKECMRDLESGDLFFWDNSRRIRWDCSFTIRSRGRWGKCG